MLPQTVVPVRPAGLPPLDSPGDSAGGAVGRDGGPDLLALGRLGGSGPVTRLWVHGMGVRSTQLARLLSIPGGLYRWHPRRRVTCGSSPLHTQQSYASCQAHSYLMRHTFPKASKLYLRSAHKDFMQTHLQFFYSECEPFICRIGVCDNQK